MALTSKARSGKVFWMKKLPALKGGHTPWILLMVVAVASRFWGLCHYDIWYDEASSALAATIDYTTYYRHDYIAYGYYALLHHWIKIFGPGLFALRSLSVIASVLCVYPLYRFTESFLDKKIAFVATALFVLSPFQIWYAQEARNYSLMACESLFFTYMLWRYHQTRSVRYVGMALLIFGVGFLTDYRMVLYLLGISVFFWRDLGRVFWASLCALFLLVLACVSGVLYAQWAYFLQRSFWALRPNVEDMLITLNNFIFGYIRQPESNGIMLGLTALLLTAVILMSLRDRRIWGLKAFCFVPIVVAWIFSQFSVSVYIDRFFIVCAPAWYILIACWIVRMRRGIAKTMVVALWSGCLLFALLFYYTGFNEEKLPLESYWYRMHKGAPFKHPVAPVFEFLRDHYEAGDMIFFSNADIRPPMVYYLFKTEGTIRRNDKWRYAYASVTDFFMKNTFFSAQKTKEMVRSGKCLALDAGAWPEAKRYWLVSSNWHRGVGYSSQDNQVLLSQYMRRTAELIGSYDIEGVTIELFVRPGRASLG